MTNAEYHAHPSISKSNLWKLSKSPEKFRYEMDHPRERTAAMLFGLAAHKILLEPDDFESEFAIAPAFDRRTKAGKEEWAAFVESSCGKDVIYQSDFDIAFAMAQSVRKNQYAATMLSGLHEQSFFWTDDLTGEQCKCRPDDLFDRGDIHIIADYKTCESADNESFQRDALKFGYHLQAAMYIDGMKANTGKDYTFVFIACEKTPPYAVNIFEADKLFVEYGRDQFREYIGIYHDCKQTGNWYGYTGPFGAINTLGLPAYLRKDFEK